MAVLELTSEMVKTHNGKITITNPITGGHATLRIRTQKDSASFKPGERILSLLIGKDNENDYKSFACVKPDGTIALWRKHHGTKMEVYARLLSSVDAMRKRGFTFLLSGTCRKCNKTLTVPESIKSGIGPICAGRL